MSYLNSLSRENIQANSVGTLGLSDPRLDSRNSILGLTQTTIIVIVQLVDEVRASVTSTDGVVVLLSNECPVIAVRISSF